MHTKRSFFFLALIGLGGLSVSMVTGAEPIRAPLPITVSSSDTTVDTVIKQLGQSITIDKPIEAPLKEVIDYLHEKCGVNILVDAVAFRNGEPPLEDVESCKLKLPRMRNARLDTVMRALLRPIDGTILVRRDHIEVTTLKEAIRECGEHFPPPEDTDEDGNPRLVGPFGLVSPFVPIGVPRPRWPLFVQMTFNARSLTEIVREVQDANPECNILIAPQAVEKAKTVLTGRLINLPLHRALLALTEMAELKIVPLNNVILITTPDRAEAFLGEIAENEVVRRVQFQLALRQVFLTPKEIRRSVFPVANDKTLTDSETIAGHVRRIIDRQRDPAPRE